MEGLDIALKRLTILDATFFLRAVIRRSKCCLQSSSMVVASNDKPEQHFTSNTGAAVRYMHKADSHMFIYNIYPFRISNLSNPRAEDCQWS